MPRNESGQRAAGLGPAALRALGDRPSVGRFRSLRILLALLASTIGFGGFVPSSAQAVPPGPEISGEAADDDGCAPFESALSPTQLAQLDTGRDEPGVAAERPAAGAAGQIVTLPSAGPSPSGSGTTSEAILALPKGSDRNFQLGPGARIVESYWSPVLCATVAKIAGPAGAMPDELVPDAPSTAALVPNHVYATAAEEIRPTAPDPYRPLQWGLAQAGTEAASGISDGSGAVVALLDSAPDTNHRDLGSVEVVPVEGGPDPGAAGAHGTLMAGVIGATAGNGFGIAGLAPAARLVAVPVCTPRGSTASDSCPLFTVLRGVDRAWDAGAQVMNLSIVGPDNPLLRRGMDRLDELGAVVVAAAGNEGTDAARFPAAYASVVGVGGHDREGRRDDRSNYGPSAELLAPGVEILSAVPGDAFAFASGTSFGASHVSGLLGVLIGAGLDPLTARQLLFQTAASQPAPGAPRLPAACRVLARAGRSCEPDR